MHPHAAPTRHAGIPGRAEASVVEIDEPEIEVELQLEAVVQLDLVVAAVALANKNARVVWALMTSGERYREPVVV